MTVSVYLYDVLRCLLADYLDNPPEPQRFLELLETAIVRNRIDSVGRVLYFLAQVLHESGEFRYFEELGTGEDYEGREDLGNVCVGDGKKFKGRGLIQLTGRFNYAKYSAHIRDPKIDLEKTPELLSQYPLAVLSAGWFWRVNQLNKYADQLDFKALTKAINGGLNGYDSRLHYLHLLEYKLKFVVIV